MFRILVVTDVPWARNEVHAAVSEPDHILIDHQDPATAAARATDEAVDVAIVDLQVGSMGGMAVARAIRDEAAMIGAEAIPTVLLLDRAADAFLARRSGAAGWVTKPFTAQQLRDQLAGVVAPKAETAADE